MVDSLNVLVVEDDPEDRAALVAIVTAAGLVPHCATNAKTARALLAKGFDWQAMTFDVGLPDGDGLELLGEARKSYPDVAALVLTSIPKIELSNAACDLRALCAYKGNEDRARVQAFLEHAISRRSTGPDPLWAICETWGNKLGLKTTWVRPFRLA